MSVFVASSGRRYSVVGEAVGSGGFSSIVPAEDEAGRRYALKSLRLPGLSPELLRQETDRLRQVEHPNVIRFHDAGSDPVDFLVMELASSGTLKGRLADARRRGRSIPLGTIVDWAGQLLDGLAAIHLRMLHCDLNPGNVLFSGPVPKIADFGSARPLGEQAPVGRFDTTPRYMPPEGWLGSRARAPGPAYDLYGVGLMVYEMATLEPAFAGDRDEVRAQHLIRRPPRPTLLRPDLPEALERLVLQLLEKDPDRRGASAAACRARLSELSAEMSPRGTSSLDAPRGQS